MRVGWVRNTGYGRAGFSAAAAPVKHAKTCAGPETRRWATASSRGCPVSSSAACSACDAPFEANSLPRRHGDTEKRKGNRRTEFLPIFSYFSLFSVSLCLCVSVVPSLQTFLMRNLLQAEAFL